MKRLFVGNLSFSAGEDDIRSAFSKFGTVNSVRVMTDRETGRSRGFAFVDMENNEDAEKAINALNGADMNGRTLRVNEAQPKPEGFGGGGGGRGGRGDAGGGYGGRRENRREPRW